MPGWRSRSALIVAVTLAVPAGCSSSPGAVQHWREVDGEAFRVGGHWVAVTALLAGQAPEPWLAVGWQADSQGVQSPLGWSSAEGSQWSRDGIRPSSFDGPLDHLFGLARRGSVAVTAGVTQSATEGSLRPSMWHRDADGAWHEVPAPRELFGGERAGGLTTVATTPAGFILAGGWTGLDELFDVGVWTSAAGTAWTHVDGEPALSPRRAESIRAISASGGAAGVVLAGEADLGAARRGVAWWSADGRHWIRNDVAGSASLQRVVVVPGGFVALGLRTDGTAASWRSADGRTWRAAGRLPGASGVTLTGAAADTGAPSVIVAGVAGGRVRLWRSSDGGSWRALRLPGGLAAIDSATSVVVAAGSGTVVVVVDTPGRGGPWLWRLS